MIFYRNNPCLLLYSWATIFEEKDLNEVLFSSVNFLMINNLGVPNNLGHMGSSPSVSTTLGLDSPYIIGVYLSPYIGVESISL